MLLGEKIENCIKKQNLPPVRFQHTNIPATKLISRRLPTHAKAIVTASEYLFEIEVA